MGGSGSGSGGGSSAADAASLAADVRAQLEQQERRGEVDRFLAEQLVAYNDRDHDLVAERIDEIERSLEDVAEIDRTIFGGSVNKHTYVDGLSDVDALVILDREPSDTRTPADLRAEFESELSARIPRANVLSIKAGDLAVTVTYTDGQQVQILPALQTTRGTFISSEDGQTWRRIDPGKFAKQLTKVNQDAGGGVVPAIKIAKSVVSGMPEGQRLKSYHLESLAVAAFESYTGPYSRSAMVEHLFRTAATNVRAPIADVSGQSARVDDYLGARDSPQRQTVSRALTRIANVMRDGDSATWQGLLGE